VDDFGATFGALPFLTHERDIEAHEGPILSELRSPGGALFVEKWCACQGDVVRTLVVRSDQRALAEYLVGRTALIELLTKPNNDVGFLVDRSVKEPRRVQLVQVSSLPSEYLPKPGAKHDVTMRPDWTTTPQTFLLDTEWDAKLLSDLEKLYLTVYAVNFFTAPENDASPPPAMQSYVLNGGYSYWRLFDLLRRSVPKSEKARSVGVAAASPGVLTIAAPTEAAGRIAAAMSSVARPNTVKAYRTLHDWSRIHESKAASVPSAAVENLRRLSALLGVDCAKLLPETHTPQHVLRAGKIIAAYYRRLWRLLEPQWEGVEFLAPGVVRGDKDAPTSVYDDEEEEEEEEELDLDDEEGP
jgi:hypothetical protein